MDEHSMSMPKTAIQQAFDEMAPDYDRKLWFDNHVLGVARLRKNWMAQASGKILDVACGTGLNFPHFVPDSEIAGIDLSPEMLALAQERARNMGLNVKLWTMDAEALDFEDDSFDTVVSALSTCTIPNPVAALREMGRVCKPEGRILLLEHGRSSFPLLAHHQDRNAYRHFEQAAGCRWNQEPLDLVKAAGLQIVNDRRSRLGLFYRIEATSKY